MTGFVVMHREAADHPLFRDDPSRLGAWCWLIMRACWKPTKFNINGAIITLQRGELCMSRSQLAKAWGWSESSVERFLTRLKTEQMIERATGQGKSVITICNYSKYQDVEREPGQATGQATGQASDSDRTAKEQRNNITNLEGREEGASAHESEPEIQHKTLPVKTLSDEVPPDHFDCLSLAQECARAGGIRFNDAGHISTGVNLIREWQQAGADPPLMLAVIGEVISTTTQTGIGSLKFFDRAIRKAIAQREAKKNGIQPKHCGGPGREPTFSELALAAADRFRSQGGAGVGGSGGAAAGWLEHDAG